MSQRNPRRMNARQFFRSMKRMTPRQRAYRYFLLSEKWLQLAWNAKAAAGHKCQQCGKSEHLEAHHIRYPVMWEDTKLDDLRVLCRNCHKGEHCKPHHQRVKRVKKLTTKLEMTPQDIRKLQKSRGKTFREWGIKPARRYYAGARKSKWVQNYDKIQISRAPRDIGAVTSPTGISPEREHKSSLGHGQQAPESLTG